MNSTKDIMGSLFNYPKFFMQNSEEALLQAVLFMEVLDPNWMREKKEKYYELMVANPPKDQANKREIAIDELRKKFEEFSNQVSNMKKPEITKNFENFLSKFSPEKNPIHVKKDQIVIGRDTIKKDKQFSVSIKNSVQMHGRFLNTTLEIPLQDMIKRVNFQKETDNIKNKMKEVHDSIHPSKDTQLNSIKSYISAMMTKIDTLEYNPSENQKNLENYLTVLRNLQGSLKKIQEKKGHEITGSTQANQAEAQAAAQAKITELSSRLSKLASEYITNDPIFSFLANSQKIVDSIKDKSTNIDPQDALKALNQIEKDLDNREELRNEKSFIPHR